MLSTVTLRPASNLTTVNCLSLSIFVFLAAYMEGHGHCLEISLTHARQEAKIIWQRLHQMHCTRSTL